MKKILLTSFACIALSSYTTTQGAEEVSCLIENEPAPILLDYVQNNRTVVKNITKAIREKGQKATSLGKSKNYGQGLIIRSYNEIINWGSYGSYFDYYILFPVLNSVPYQVKRDYRMLEAENEGLNKYLKKVIQKGYSSISLTKEEACRGVSANCSLSGNIGSIVGNLIKNNSQVLHLYRETVIGDNSDFENYNSLILIDKETLEKVESGENYMVQYYGKGNNCNEAKGSFGERIKKLKKRITENAKGTKKGIQQWKDGWALATGINTPQEKEIEKELLARELARQGVGSNAAEASLKALKDFNTNTGYTFDLNNPFGKEESYILDGNNPISNTYKFLVKTVNNQYKKFKKDVFEDAFDKREQASEEASKSIHAILNQNKESNIDLKIATSIAELYASQIPIAAETQVKSASLETRITNLHTNLNVSIKTLSEETCKNAVKVCNQQDYGKGNCGKCD